MCVNAALGAVVDLAAAPGREAGALGSALIRWLESGTSTAALLEALALGGSTIAEALSLAATVSFTESLASVKRTRVGFFHRSVAMDSMRDKKRSRTHCATKWLGASNSTSPNSLFAEMTLKGRIHASNCCCGISLRSCCSQACQTEFKGADSWWVSNGLGYEGDRAQGLKTSWQRWLRATNRRPS